MLGFYVRDGEAIASGAKSAVVTPTERADISGPRILVTRDGKQAYAVGVVIFLPSQVIDACGFAASEKAHGVSAANRERWWPDQERFWLHAVKAYYPLANPQPVQFEPGVNMNIAVPVEVKVLSTGSGPDGRWVYTVGLELSAEGVVD